MRGGLESWLVTIYRVTVTRIDFIVTNNSRLLSLQFDVREMERVNETFKELKIVKFVHKFMLIIDIYDYI